MPTNKQFMFYDIESSGLNKCFDQVLQFAAIWTDSELNEIKREEIIVNLTADTVPNPYASITHRITLEKLESGINEYQAIKKIHSWFNTSNTITIGYNTLGFDDEFLRFSFYRHLLPAYSHQYANGCQRMDMYPIALLYKLFANDSLKWPQAAGKPSMKLEAINKANNLASGRAHDAIVDVEITLELARRLAKNKAMWQYCLKQFDKKIDTEQMTKLSKININSQQPSSIALMIQASFSAKNNYQAAVIYLGNHKIYKNQSLWLRLDDKSFKDIKQPQWQDETWVVSRRAAEQNWLLPYKEKYQKHLAGERLKQTQDNIAWLQNNPQAFEELVKYNCNKTWPEIKNIDPQAALYTRAFPTRQDLDLWQQFHLTEDAAQKLQISNQFNHLQDQQLAQRVLARHYLEQLNNEQQKTLTNCLTEQRIDFKGQAAETMLSQQTLIKQVEDDEKQLDQEQLTVLDELRQWNTKQATKANSLQQSKDTA